MGDGWAVPMCVMGEGKSLEEERRGRYCEGER